MSNENTPKDPSKIGRRPLIGSGRSLQQQITDLSPSEIEAREKAGIPRDAELTADEIENRTKEKADLVAQANAAIPAEEPPVVAVTPLGAQLDKIAAAQRGATREAAAAQTAEAEALGRPLLVQAHALSTRIGRLRSEHRDKISDVARRPWQEILRAVPDVATYAAPAVPTSGADGETLGLERAASGLAGAHGRPAFVSQRFYISELARVARELNGALANTFPDLVAAAAEVTDFIGSGPERRGVANEYGQKFEVVIGGGTHDPIYGVLSTAFRRAVTHLRVHVERTQQQLATAESLLVLFANLQERVEPLLANLVIEPVAAPPRVALPALPDPPAPRGTTSYVDFDAREHPATWGKETADKTGAQKIGDGFRVGNTNVPEWPPGGRGNVKQVN